MTGQLSGKAALVIGGTRGIGGAISRRLAGQGASVAMIHLNRTAEAADLAAEISGRAFQADIGDQQAQEAAMDAAIGWLGRLDILVCNAGLTITGALADYADDAFDRVFAVNVRAPFHAARRAARTMADGGRIVMIGSIVSQRLPGPGVTLYAASKSALDGMVRGLARDLGERGITANVVHPGITATERNPPGSSRGDPSKAPLAIRRQGTPEEVAALVAHLVSDEAGYITGSSLYVDGGWAA